MNFFFFILLFLVPLSAMAEEDGKSQPVKIDIFSIDGATNLQKLEESIKKGRLEDFINLISGEEIQKDRGHYLREGWIAAVDFCNKEMLSDLDACMGIVESSRYFDVDAFSICKRLKRLDCLDAIENKSYYSAAFQIDNVEARLPNQQIEYLKTTGVIANAPNLCAHNKLLGDPRCRPPTVNPVFREGPDGRYTPINVYMGGMRIIDEDEKQ